MIGCLFLCLFSRAKILHLRRLHNIEIEITQHGTVFTLHKCSKRCLKYKLQKQKHTEPNRDVEKKFEIFHQCLSNSTHDENSHSLYTDF